MNKYNSYKNLLSKSYDEAVAYLLLKYGCAEDDYYREKSYQRFLNGEIKNITKGKYSRTSEGLYCHHIDEMKELKISDQSFVKINNIPYAYQKKERLVYCDLIEHAILHVLITKETSQEFGLPGYLVFLKPTIEQWYIDEIVPTPPWMKNCYNKAFLYPEEAVNILQAMQETLGLSYFNSPDEFHEDKRRKIEEYQAIKKRREVEDKERAKRVKEKEKQIFKAKTEQFYRDYPKFEPMNIRFDSPRRKVIAMLYDYTYSDIYKSKKELDVAMKPVIKDDLFKELYVSICNRVDK